MCDIYVLETQLPNIHYPECTEQQTMLVVRLSVQIKTHSNFNPLGRLRGLAVACWTAGHNHPYSNLDVGISEGCFMHLAYQVYKSGRKTSIIIIIINWFGLMCCWLI